MWIKPTEVLLSSNPLWCVLMVMPCNNFIPIIRTIEKSNDFFCLQKRRGHSEKGERSTFTSKVVGTLDSIMDTKVCVGLYLNCPTEEYSLLALAVSDIAPDRQLRF